MHRVYAEGERGLRETRMKGRFSPAGCWTLHGGPGLFRSIMASGDNVERSLVCNVIGPYTRRSIACCK